MSSVKRGAGHVKQSVCRKQAKHSEHSHKARQRARTKQEAQRVRTVKISLCVMIAMLLILAIVRGAHQNLLPFQTWELLLSKDTESGQDDPAAQTDPLGISSEELLFEQSTHDGSVVWYRTQGGKTFSLCLIEVALTAQGWSVCQDDEQGLSSYIRHLPGSGLAEYALVLCYEQPEGCAIIIEVI